MLGFFKYFNFFVDNVHVALASLGLHAAPPALAILLPAGISFYTFQALSYTIDVYKGEMRARRDPIDFALFVAFFPHLVAGPIMRAQNLLVQVERPRTFSADAARSGLVLMAWGFFKKLVVADNVAVIANRVFAHEAPTFEVLWAGVFAFGMQIYADFSAYSDIARGVARWFGFELIVNFNHPYIAHSPTDFWRRWHISLSTWFRDYVYIPLGGNRVPASQREINLLATFVISGFWHGASWNFVLWGFYHGMLVVVTRTLARCCACRSAGPVPCCWCRSPDLRADGRRLAVLPRDQPGFPVPLPALSPFATRPRNGSSRSPVRARRHLVAAAVRGRRAGALARAHALSAAGGSRGGRSRGWRRRRSRSGRFTLILVLRSQVSFDFIYFRF